MMLVESFECSEVKEEASEMTDEAIALIEKLGLGGQQNFVSPKKEGQDTANRCPYREMLDEEFHVYGALCPEKTKLCYYKSSPIPLRVLQIAAHASEFFPHLEVWDKESSDVKDPVLVATNGKDSWQSGFARYILARWGEVLEPFHVLKQRAIAAKRAEHLEAAESVLAQVKAATERDLLRKNAVSW